ncbi:MAG: DMT family transporter [Pseudomonadota bacterium]
MLATCVLLAAVTLIAKLLGAQPDGLGLHPFQISAARFLFAWVAISVVVAVLRPNFQGTHWPNHIARSVLGWLSGTCLFAAAALIPLASATALSFLSPVVTMVLAMFLLSEKVGRWRWSAAGIALIGALVLTQPGSDTFQIGALIAIAAALFMGMEGIFLKKLSDTEPAVRILFVNNSIGMLVSVSVASFFWTWPTAEGWALMAAIGLTMIVAQALLIQAMKRGDASLLVPLFYTILIFSGLLDFAVFGVIPELAAWIGAALIVCGAVIISIRGRRQG